MASAKTKSKAKSKKRITVKDLKPKDGRSVKGGDISFTKVVDKSSPTLLS